MVSARVKISWPKYGISVAALALLKSMAVCSVPPATGTPKRVPKYLATSNLKSKSSTRNSPSPGEKLKLFVGSSRSMIVAPALLIASMAASNAATTCGGALSMPCRVTPSRTPLRPAGFRNAL